MPKLTVLPMIVICAIMSAVCVQSAMLVARNDGAFGRTPLSASQRPVLSAQPRQRSVQMLRLKVRPQRI